MTNPVNVPCLEDVWTPVALAVQTGMVWKHRMNLKYIHTYVDAGDPIPTDDDEGAPFEEDGLPISSPVNVDVYIKCTNGDGAVVVGL